jgi:SAM-dependent methyltransferase
MPEIDPSEESRTHQHGELGTADEEPFGRAYWEERYAEPGLTWSGKPNAVLVSEAAGLTPGRALDIGSGEGGDALWLAQHGWSVTGVDISANALDKARSRIELADRSAAELIRWEQHDLSEWLPRAQSFDLVSSHFMHLPEPVRGRLFRSLAAAVAPGGTLLIVGHDVSDTNSGLHRADHPELMFGASDVLTAIESERLSVAVAESRERHVTGGHDTATVMRDIVVKAVRAPRGY